MEQFRIRPAHGGTNLLIELCGDHRAPGYPKVAALLAAALGATWQAHPVFSAASMMATDRYFSCWTYDGGTYEIDDDVQACCITAADGNAGVIADLEQALTASGLFVRAP